MCPIETKILKEKGKVCEVKRHGIFKTRVSDYLKQNLKYGFTQKDISEEFETSVQQSRQTLMRLVKEGIVVREELPTKVETPTGIRNTYQIFYRWNQ